MLHLLVLIFACATSIIYAADNPESNILTFETNQIRAVNPNHPASRILNTIDLSQEESHTKKTFGELFRNAQEQKLPWAVVSWVMNKRENTDANFTIDQLDLIELVRAYKRYDKNHFRSTEATTDVISASLTKCLHYSNPFQTLRSTYDIRIFIPTIDKIIPGLDFSMDASMIHPKINRISHTGAILGVALCKDNVNAALFLKGIKDAIKKDDFTGKTTAEKEAAKACCTIVAQFWDQYFAAMPSEQNARIQQEVDAYLKSLSEQARLQALLKPEC